MTAQIVLRGPMSRYGFRGKIFIKDTPMEVSDDLASALLDSSSGTIANFEKIQETPKATRKPRAKSKANGKGGVHIKAGPGGKTADGKDKTWHVGSFDTKIEAVAYARDVHGVTLGGKFALKTLNNTTVVLHERAEKGLEGPDLWAGLAGVIAPVGEDPKKTKATEGADKAPEGNSPSGAQVAL